MIKTIRKSKQLYAIALNRLNDYKELLLIEMKLQGRDVGMQIMGYVLGAVFALLAAVFLGVAIIVSAWETNFRTEVAWLVFIAYVALAAGLVYFARHLHAESTLSTLRNELRHDIDALKESL